MRCRRLRLGIDRYSFVAKAKGKIMEEWAKREWRRIIGEEVTDWEKPKGKSWRPRFVRLTIFHRLRAWWAGVL